MNASTLKDLIQEQEQGLLFALEMERKASDSIMLCWSALHEAREQHATFSGIRATHAQRLSQLYQRAARSGVAV